MGEILPVITGALVGAAGLGISSRRLRAAWIAAMSLAFGVVATLINGEELFFIPVDMALAGLCACVVVVVAPRLWGRVAATRGGVPPEARREERGEGSA